MTTEPPDVEVLDVFVLDDHGQLRTPPPTGADVPGLRHAAQDAVRHLQAVKATPGHRLGNEFAAITRAGASEEVIHPVLIDADRAVARLCAGDALASLPDLWIDLDSRQVDGSSVTWDARLDTGAPRGERAAFLRLRPTPARTVTIIELIPVRPRRFGLGSFVRRGVVAVSHLEAVLRSAGP
jgi:hypothetical protein